MFKALVKKEGQFLKEVRVLGSAAESSRKTSLFVAPPL